MNCLHGEPNPTSHPLFLFVEIDFVNYPSPAKILFKRIEIDFLFHSNTTSGNIFVFPV